MCVRVPLTVERHSGLESELMSIDLTISSEQASLLLPILQQIQAASPSVTTVSTPIKVTPEPGPGIHRDESSSSCPPSSSLSRSSSSASAYSRGYTSTDTEAGYTSGGPRYSLEELVKKKKKNTKATEAQNYAHVSCYT